MLWKLFTLFYIAFNSVHNCVALLSGLGQVISMWICQADFEKSGNIRPVSLTSFLGLFKSDAQLKKMYR